MTGESGEKDEPRGCREYYPYEIIVNTIRVKIGYVITYVTCPMGEEHAVADHEAHP